MGYSNRAHQASALFVGAIVAASAPAQSEKKPERSDFEALKADPRLNVLITGVFAKKKVPEVFRLLSEQTNLVIEVKDGADGTRVAKNLGQAHRAPAWRVLRGITKLPPHGNGRWEKTERGWALVGDVPIASKVPESASRPEQSNFGWMLLIWSGGGAALLAGIWFVRRKLRSACPKSA
jgi:hypothetical protein